MRIPSSSPVAAPLFGGTAAHTPVRFSGQDIITFGTSKKTPSAGPSGQLLSEINEQPARLQQLIDRYPDLLDGVRLPDPDTRRLIAVAEGSSLNAVQIAKPFIAAWAGLAVDPLDPEKAHNQVSLSPASLADGHFITVSQSGRTRSVRDRLDAIGAALGKAKTEFPITAFTNNADSPLATEYQSHVALGAGPEESVAATKSMTTSILALLLMGLALGERRGNINASTARQAHESLQRVPDSVQRLLNHKPALRRLQATAQRLTQTDQFILLSKGWTATVLPEAGLKLMETSSNSVYTDNTESFKHGPKVLLKGVNGTPPNVLYVIPPNMAPDEAAQMFSDIKSHFYNGDTRQFDTQRVNIIRYENSPAVPADLKQALALKAEQIVTLPPVDAGIPELFTGLVAFQLLSAYLAEAKGTSPNSPVLQKAVVS